MGRRTRGPLLSHEAVAWVFNLDAEDELKRRGPHTPTEATRVRAQGLLPLLKQLMQPEDEVAWPAEMRNPRALWGRAWCPTPWACETLHRAGLRVPEAPSAQVLREVNHRAFANALGQTLPSARLVQTRAELAEMLSDMNLLVGVSVEQSWLMKHALSYAGRGRRKVASGALRQSDQVWVDAALSSGDGLQVEPFVVRDLDCGLHGWIGSDGTIVLGQPTLQRIDASGRWLSTELAPSLALGPSEHVALEHAARETAEALVGAGYFGPFGLDAFRWRAPDGTTRFQPRCELNARYSMGWAIGMGDFRAPVGCW